MYNTSSISDETILSWRSQYDNKQAQQESGLAVIKSLTNIARTFPGEERVHAIYACMDTLVKHMPQVSKSKPLLQNLSYRLNNIYKQTIEKSELEYVMFRERCMEVLTFVKHVIELVHPSIQLQIPQSEVQVPTRVMREYDPFDPMTLEPLEKGTVYAFYKDHFVGSLNTISEMIERGIRKTTKEIIFAATLNQHVPFSELMWLCW